MIRRLGWSVFVFTLAGCSTHPVVDVADFIFPGKMGPNEVTPYGGVWAQQHALAPLAPLTPGGVDPFPPPPGGGVVPPPAPLPPRPATGFQLPQLQPPMPAADVPPPMPPPPPPNMRN
jgi:hypothetical protein